MNIKSIVLAATVIAAVPALAHAQSAPSPNNTSGAGVSKTAPAPTDPALGNESGNTKGMPERATRSGTMQPSAGTTGSGANTNMKNTKDTMKKNESPASQGSGISKEK